MGHNLGMAHDFGSCQTCYKLVDGKACKGYMDYTDSTNYWSHCSVNDFTDYINRQQNFCLAPLNGSGGSGKKILQYPERLEISNCPILKNL